MGGFPGCGRAYRVVLRLDLARTLPRIEADATQIRQVVMNLITNASEAVGERSGVIVLRTGAMEARREYLGETYLDEQLAEGVYVYLEVSDNGEGMDAATRERIFDPFFTTKFAGRGLGLAAVLGIIRGHRGAIKVYSEPGRGTTFKVLLPAAESVMAEQSEAPVQRERSRPRRRARVLVVDDEDTVRVVVRGILEALDYDVITAADGREALQCFAQRAADIDLVLLDMSSCLEPLLEPTD